MAEKDWIIYGATGYTGKLIAREAKKRGLRPVLAGRNSEKVRALANELSLPWKAFALENTAETARALKGMTLVLHCAGPFIETAQPMAAACLTEGVHYLDITGEIPVYELLQKLDDQAKKSKVMLLPGTGFDIVPTDCVAAQLKAQLPSATHLSLAFAGLGGVSAGTMKSALAQLPEGSKIRQNGKLVTIPMFSKERKIKLYRDEINLFAIPWGDVFTAYYSTGIPNIEVFTMLPEAAAFFGKLARPLTSLLKNESILKIGQNLVDVFVTGPDAEKREKGYSIVWGEVKNAKGEKRELRIKTHEGYQFTVVSSLAIVERVLGGKALPGFQTPSLVFGAEFVLELPGSKILKG